MGSTKELAQYIESTTLADMPVNVVEMAKKTLLDWIGVTVGGTEEQASVILRDLVSQAGGKAQSSILGWGLKTSVFQAALVNGTMSHVLDYDDSHSEIRTHCSAPLVPAILAVAENRRLSGAELILALIVGFEVAVRIGRALGKCHYLVGWHATSVIGRIAAAAGVGKLLRLNEKQLCSALALAATQAGGVQAVFGTMGKPFHAGKAASDGALAAVMASKGFTAPNAMLDAEGGFGYLFSSDYRPEELVLGLGTSYAILGNSLKPYAACLFVHPVVDGVIELRSKDGVIAEEVEQIVLTIATLNFKVAGNPSPKNGMEGKFSIQFCAALALLCGQANNCDFADHRLSDPRIQALMSKVSVVCDDKMGETQAGVEVMMRNGSVYRTFIKNLKGGPANPLSFDEIADKASMLAAIMLDQPKIDRIIGVVKQIERLRNVRALVKLCCRISL